MQAALHSPSSLGHLPRWSLALIWLALGALLVAVLWSERQALEARERQHLAHQAHTIHDNLVYNLRSVDRALTIVMADLERWQAEGEDIPHINNRLRAFADAIIGVHTLSWIDAKGVIQASSREELLGTDVRGQQYFQAALQASSMGSLVVGAPVEILPGFWVTNLVRSYPAPEGGFGGVVVATLDPQVYLTLLESVRYAPDVRTGLTHGDGVRFVLVADRTLPQMAQRIAPGTVFAQHLASGQSANVLRGNVEPGGPLRLVALQNIQPAELRMDKPLIASAGRDWNVLMAPWRSQAQTWIGLWALGGLALTLAAAVLERRQRDIQAHEQALAQIEGALQERWEAVLQATGQGVWDLDVRTGKAYHSPVWKQMTGYDASDPLVDLQHWRERVHPDDLARVHADYQRHLDGQAPYFDSVFRTRRQDGRYFWIHDRGQVVERDAAGQAVRMMGAQVDVTQQRMEEEKLDRLADNVPGMLFQFQLEPGGHSHFPYASRGVQDIYGFNAKELHACADPVFMHIAPEDLSPHLASLQASARDLSLWKAEYRYHHPERGVRWLSALARPQRLEGGAVLWHGYTQDVTESKEQAMQLEQTERFLQHLLKQMPIGLAMADEQGRVYFRNRRFLEAFGYSEDETLSVERWWQDAYPDPALREEARRAWHTAKELAHSHDGVIASQEYRLRLRSGAERIMAIGGVLYGTRLLTTFEDRTEQHAHSAMLQQLAYMDGLTGISNRRGFDQRLQAEWRRCWRSGQPLSLVMVDIDHFKEYNDLYGHQQGDECLQAVANVLRDGLGRPHDLVARYGGEEFVCLLPEVALEGARAKAQALCEAVRQLALPHSGSLVAPIVTISAGVASQVPDAAGTPEMLLAHADAHLYRAKAAGRNRVHTGANDDARHNSSP